MICKAVNFQRKKVNTICKGVNSVMGNRSIESDIFLMSTVCTRSRLCMFQKSAASVKTYVRVYIHIYIYIPSRRYTHHHARNLAMCNLHAVSRSPRGGVTSVFLSQSARTRSRCLRLNKRDFRGEREREREREVRRLWSRSRRRQHQGNPLDSFDAFTF